MKQKIRELQAEITSAINTSPFGGSNYTVDDVVRIVELCIERVEQIIDEHQATTPALNDNYVLILEQYAKEAAQKYAYDCAESYNFDEDITYDCDERGTSLMVKADIRVDCSDISEAGTFDGESFRQRVKQLLNL